MDISADAVKQAERNAELNALKNCTFRTANVFDYLTEADRRGEKWDVIVLDPPAFAKNRGALENATRGYKEINLRALKCLRSGGFLVTCSCSQHMSPDRFRKMLAEAAQDAGKRVREKKSVQRNASPGPSDPVGCSGNALLEVHRAGGAATQVDHRSTRSLWDRNIRSHTETPSHRGRNGQRR